MYLIIFHKFQNSLSAADVVVFSSLLELSNGKLLDSYSTLMKWFNQIYTSDQFKVNVFSSPIIVVHVTVFQSIHYTLWQIAFAQS